MTPGPPVVTCANNPTANITGTTSTTGGQWSGGTGSYFPNANKLIATYTPSAAEIAAGTVTLTLTSTGTGFCIPATGTLTITILPTPVLTGPATVTVCAANPTATVGFTPPAGSGLVWTGGAGSYLPSSTSNTINYTLSNSEILAGHVPLTATTTNTAPCSPVSAQVDVLVAPAPTIEAGSDQVLCGNTTSVVLNGTVTGATGGTWTSNGTGTFANATSLATTYTPSVADRNSGLVTITFTSTGNGSCAAVSDQMTISFTVIPTVNAGADKTICTNTEPALLNGSGTPGVWSGGAGTFAPSAASMNASYTPTPAERTAGTVTLTLTTNPSGACPQVSDQMTLTILPSPIANAGVDIAVCGNQNVIALAGSVNAQATGGFWSTTGTGTLGDPTVLSTTYTPSLADKTAGTVTLTLTTTGNGNCGPHSDNVLITIAPSVTVFAGPDQTLCRNGNNLPLSGTVTGATGGIWSIVTGSGTLTNATSVNSATYTPNAADATVTLRLTTTGSPAACVAQSDDIIFTLSPIPVVTVGTNQTICGDLATVSLTGTVINASGQLWTTTGAGTFSPSNSSANTSYIPAANETGTLTFTLTSTRNGICTGVYSSSMQVTITPKPTINAGIDRTVCRNNPAVTLTATTTVATGGNWTSLGDGTFSAISANGLTATYTPGTADISNGTVNLQISSTGNGTCTTVQSVPTMDWLRWQVR